jgi:hypothetical protein
MPQVAPRVSGECGLDLMLVDVGIGIGNRRLTIAGRVRPLDDLSLKLLLDRLEHRRARWPNTANLDLLINNQTANKTTRAVGNHWISAAMRGQTATRERLRVDRQLEEAVDPRPPDPLRFAEVFGPATSASPHPRTPTARPHPADLVREFHDQLRGQSGPSL